MGITVVEQIHLETAGKAWREQGQFLHGLTPTYSVREYILANHESIAILEPLTAPLSQLFALLLLPGAIRWHNSRSSACVALLEHSLIDSAPSACWCSYSLKNSRSNSWPFSVPSHNGILSVRGSSAPYQSFNHALMRSIRSRCCWSTLVQKSRSPLRIVSF